MKKRTKLAVRRRGPGRGRRRRRRRGDELTPSDESKAVVEDAAKQLGVDPAKLNDALKQALENRIDAAVKAGR